MRDLPLVLGTAGHIDHGKTSLVHALTGVDTDRLAIEKARGITTELGFAPLVIGERRIAVVDVPGHERFVKSMVAGATGLDVVMLVVAADAGVMPQTREHLAICDLLGVRRGLVALTKIDLVDDDEWLALITNDVRTALAGTFLADAPILGVSTKRPDTIAQLARAIGALVAAITPRAPTGVFRLPIDRVFTIKGFGTVVTGTILGGSVALGDEVTVIPSGKRARVRGIEIHGGAAPSAHAGLRAAVNLGGIAVEDLARGDLLAHVDTVAASHILDVELAAPLPRQKVLLHHASAQHLATLEPVSDRFAQLRLDARTPVGALPGDRFIVRGFVPSATHGTTIGGGTIVRALAPRAKHPEHAATVTALATARTPDARIALEVKAAAAAGLVAGDLVRRLGLAADALAEPLATLVASGELLAAGDHYVHATAVAALEAKIVGELGQPRETVRAKLPAALPARAFDAILEGLVRRNLVALDHDALVKPTSGSAAPKLSPAEAALLAQFAAWGLEPPRPDTLAKPVLDRLVAQKLVTRIKPDYIVHAGALAELRARIVAHLDAHGTIDPAQYKQLTGASRKFTIPLAEHFDAEKLTLRVGDLRRRR